MKDIAWLYAHRHELKPLSLVYLVGRIAGRREGKRLFDFDPRWSELQTMASKLCEDEEQGALQIVRAGL